MPQPSLLGTIILLIPMLTSAALFWRRFGRVVEILRRARPDPDFHLRPLAPRIRQFVWEVLLQAKVIQERPLAGLAHAFVFWGFCAFALITLNHLRSEERRVGKECRSRWSLDH